MAIIPIKDLNRQIRVGDRVLIRSDLQRGCFYYMHDSIERMGFIAEMMPMMGEIATIKIVADSSYRLEEFTWNWTDGMFVGVVVPDEDFGEINAEIPIDYLFGG